MAYYDILGLDSKNKDKITLDDIKKAYKKKVLTDHPDKGGTKEAFQNLQKAHETLSDPRKRQIYDLHGEEGLKSSGPGQSMQDIFDRVFGEGGFSMFTGGAQRSSTPTLVVEYSAPLSELFTGQSDIKLPITRLSMCISVKEYGGSTKCNICHGKGMRTIMNQLAPGLIQQINQPCLDCKGTGIDPKTGCAECKMKGSIDEKFEFTFNIEPGTIPSLNEMIIVPTQGHWDKNTGIRGPIMIKLSIEPNLHYELTNKLDLVLKYKIKLVEALTGFHHNFQFLDSKLMGIQSKPGEIITPETIHILPDKGWPIKKYSQSGRDRSNLIIKYEIEFPKSLEPDECDALKSILSE